ncbi:putative ribonuclease H-like domain-containing protein [Tanacetum coccineum]|uniref:Ribonuclease H-like domain-containing protein n=1 Tax=Tanacetum coccineum TaxID=301880 RepID=A0ABQ4ZMY6_9ASTR
MIEGNGPKWLFDIDFLTQSMNYVPVTAGTISNDSAGTSEEISQDCIMMPIWKDTSYFDSSTKDVDNDKFEDDNSTKDVNATGQHVNTASPDVNTGSLTLNVVGSLVNTASLNEQDSPKDMFTMGVSHTLEATHIKFFSDEDEPKVDLGNITNSYTVPTTPNTRIHKDHPIDNVIGNVEEMQEELLQFKLQQVWILVDLPNRKKAIGTKWVFKNKKDERGIVIRNKARVLSYGTIEEEVCVTQPPRFKDPDHPDKVYKGVKVLYGLHQAPRAWYETLANYLLGNGFKRGKIDQILFIKKQKEDILLVQDYKYNRGKMEYLSVDKYVAEILNKFNYSDVKSASTPVDLEKPLVKYGDANDVDVHLYRSMIRSLIYLTTSRPDIMFAILKGKPTLGLWYSRDSPFELVSYTDSDYAGATQIGSLQLEIRYALTVNLTIYTSCIKQFWATAKAKTINGERQIQALIDKKKVIIMKTSIRSDLHLEDAGVQITAWNEFSSTMASLITCLATNQKFNLSKSQKKQSIPRGNREEGTTVTQRRTQQEDSVYTPFHVQLSVVDDTPGEKLPQESLPSMIKDKGKAIMIEPEVPLKRKDQVALDEDLQGISSSSVEGYDDGVFELVQKLQKEEQGEIILKKDSRLKDDDIAMDAIPLATKPPMIVEYKLLKQGILYAGSKVYAANYNC